MAVDVPRSLFVSQKGDRVLAFSQDTGMCVVVNAAGRDVLDLLVSKGLLGESAATPNAQETSS